MSYDNWVTPSTSAMDINSKINILYKQYNLSLTAGEKCHLLRFSSVLHTLRFQTTDWSTRSSYWKWRSPMRSEILSYFQTLMIVRSALTKMRITIIFLTKSLREVCKLTKVMTTTTTFNPLKLHQEKRKSALMRLYLTRNGNESVPPPTTDHNFARRLCGICQ